MALFQITEPFFKEYAELDVSAVWVLRDDVCGVIAVWVLRDDVCGVQSRDTRLRALLLHCFMVEVLLMISSRTPTKVRHCLMLELLMISWI